MLRDQFKSDYSRAGIVVPSYTDLFVKLTALALEAHPLFNSRWEEDRIVTSREVHIGIATDTESGLLVPVVFNANKLTLKELSLKAQQLIEKARSRKLLSEEMQGGTFTVSNLGMYGIDSFTPIINWPECAILGIGCIRSELAIVDEAYVTRKVVTLSLTFDHRVADGGPAARFLKTICNAVENPTAWMLV
jgi:pyruvate dehydrogenase E2 component (dihydrolipoamide acetyltransferase)